MTLPGTVPRTLTVSEIARDIGLHVGTVSRWVHQWARFDWRVDTGGNGAPARMPYSYLHIARGWAQVRDPQVRELMRLMLRDDPKDFFVVVGTTAISCYDVQQVKEVTSKHIDEGQFPIGVYSLGEPTNQ